MPPIDLTLILKRKCMNGVYDYIESYGFKDDKEIILYGETYTVRQIKKSYTRRFIASNHPESKD